jgi:hypothetical protein
MKEYMALRFPNNAKGQTEKLNAIKTYGQQGWKIASETITAGKFNGGKACCWASTGCCLPLAFTAGSTDGEINVTLEKDTQLDNNDV